MNLSEQCAKDLQKLVDEHGIQMVQRVSWYNALSLHTQSCGIASIALGEMTGALLAAEKTDVPRFTHVLTVFRELMVGEAVEAHMAELLKQKGQEGEDKSGPVPRY